MKFLIAFVVSILTSPFMLLANEKLDQNALQATGRFVPFQVEAEQNVVLEIQLQMAEGYKAYEEMFELRIKTPAQGGFKLGKFYIDPIKEFFDETSKKVRRGVVGSALLKAPLEAPPTWAFAEDKIIFELTYQACTNTYCLFPKTLDIEVPFSWLGPKPLSATPIEGSTKFNWQEFLSFERALQDQNTLWLLFVLFILGILTSFTPCIYPLIPITLSVLGREAHARTKTQSFIAASVYVLGMAITYAGLGVLAASSGKLFGSFMSSPWVLGPVAGVFLLMSLSSFGLFDIQMPAKLQLYFQKQKGQGLFGVFVTGLISGVIAGPCVGPVLVGVLTFIAQTQDLWLGFWSLFAFAIGMGQILLVIGTFSNALKLLPKSGAWMEGVKTFFGIVMLGMFFYYLQMLIPNRLWEGLLGIGFILLASLKGTLQTPAPPTIKQSLKKGLSMATLLFGVFLVFWSVMDLSSKVGGPFVYQQPPSSAQLEGWQEYSEDLLTAAQASKQPVIIDFYADWCAACHELDKKTFRDPQFIATAKNKNIVLLRFDATRNTPELEILKARYQIVGLPTVIFYNSQGELLDSLRINEFKPAFDFIERMNSL